MFMLVLLYSTSSTYPPPPFSLSLYLFELDNISTKVKFTAAKGIVHKQFLWNIKDVSDVLFAQIMQGNWSCLEEVPPIIAWSNKQL